MKALQNKGYFHHLNYTIGDEDSALERQLLPEKASHVVAIAGSGARVISLLARCPNRLTCIDINLPQLYLTTLRLATLRTLSHHEFLGFWGYPPAAGGWSSQDRRDVMDDLQLSPSAASFLHNFFGSFQYGPPIYQGRFEKTLRTLSRLSSVILGNRACNVFDQPDQLSSRLYFETQFPHKRFKAVLFLLGNSVVLNSLLYRGFFPRKNIARSTYSIYKDIFTRLLRDRLPRDSFFLQMAFLGELKYPEGNPDECGPQVFDAAKRALASTDIQLRDSDYRLFFKNGAQNVDFVSFSDVPSFLPDGDAHEFLQYMKAALVRDALVVTRGHLRVAHPNTDGFRVVSDDYGDLMSRERTQLWKIQVYKREGRTPQGKLRAGESSLQLA